MMDNPTTYTNAKTTEPVTLDSIADAIRSLANASMVTMVGGRSVERLMARLGCQSARIDGWLIGANVYHCPLLPDDFLLVEREEVGVVQLFVYRLRDGELQAFEVMPGYVLYEAWRAIAGRYKREGA